MAQVRPEQPPSADAESQRARRWSTVSLVLLGAALLLFPVFVVYGLDTIPLYGNPVRTESARTAYAVAVAGAVVSAGGLAAAAVSVLAALTVRAVVAGALNALVLLQTLAMVLG
jgi:hypothetical protein